MKNLTDYEKTLIVFSIALAISLTISITLLIQ